MLSGIWDLIAAVRTVPGRWVRCWGVLEAKASGKVSEDRPSRTRCMREWRPITGPGGGGIAEAPSSP